MSGLQQVLSPRGRGRISFTETAGKAKSQTCEEIPSLPDLSGGKLE